MITRAEISNYNHKAQKIVSANYTATGYDEVLLVDCTNGGITITLPDAVGNKNLVLTIKKIDSSGNAVTIACSNSQNIDGQSTQSISSQNDEYTLIASTNSSNAPMWQSISIPTTVAGGALPITGGTLTGALNVTPTAVTTGVQTAQTITGAANTGMTASTEVPDVNFALNRTVQWATGAITTQRAVLIQAPTYAFVGASTITNAATVAITGAPVAGTNATITNAYALWVQAGITEIDGGLVVKSLTTFAPPVGTSGTPVAITYTGAAHTTLASAEFWDININLNRTVQFATGNLASQRAFLIQNPSYTFVGASTITNAATVAILGAPQAGVNATITNSWALWIQQGGTWLQSSTANALVVGNSVTNPVLQVDGSVASQVTGVLFQGQVAGGGMLIATTSSASAEPLLIQAKNNTNYITINDTLAAATNPLLITHATDVITGGVTDAYTGGLRLLATINAASALTVTRYNYIDLPNPTLGGAGPAAITDAAVMRFNANAGTHKAVDAGTTKTTPGAVTQWIKINVNGTIGYIPSYSSKTS